MRFVLCGIQFEKIILLLAISATFSAFFNKAHAIDQPRTLPHGIRTTNVSMGRYYGLNQYYSDDGDLKNLSDKNSFELDAKSLTQVNAAFADLVRVLNEHGHSLLGSQLHLGQISVKADPEVRYYAPTFGIGLTKKLTVGVALPIINYENSVNVVQSGSNLDAVKANIPNPLPEVGAAFNQLNTELKKGLNGTLAEKGYKPLESKSETFLGDVVLFSAYMFDDIQRYDLKHSLRLYLNLPTGPEADPDDLADLESFGRYSARAQWLGQIPLNKKTSLIFDGSYLFVPAQSQTKRVPINEQDVLPDANQKFKLSEDLGDTVSSGIGLSHTYDSAWSFAGAYYYQYKLKDSFSGAPNGRERYLESGTNKSAQIVKAQVSYSTIQAYFDKTFALPGSIDYEISKTMAGTNVENQTAHTLTFSLFF